MSLHQKLCLLFHRTQRTSVANPRARKHVLLLQNQRETWLSKRIQLRKKHPLAERMGEAHDGTR